MTGDLTGSAIKRATLSTWFLEAGKAVDRYCCSLSLDVWAGLLDHLAREADLIVRSHNPENFRATRLDVEEVLW